MSTISIPMAISVPTNNEGDHSWQLLVTPEGILGRHDIGAKGRANRWAMYTKGKGHDDLLPVDDLPLVMRAGVIEMNEDMLRAIVERGYGTGAEASISQQLKRVIEKNELPLVIQNQISGKDWIDSVTAPTWTEPEPEPEPEPEVEVQQPTQSGPLTTPAPLSVSDAAMVLSVNDESITAALEVHDNPAAYFVPTAVEKWMPVNFVDTDIESMEYLARARKGQWNVAITGPTGCGKSALCYNTAVQWQTPYAAIAFSEATDTTSLWDEPMLVPDGHGGTRSVRVYTAAGMVAVYGGILEFQEPNGAVDAMMTALYGLLDFGRRITLSNGATVPLHKDTLIVATQNPVDAAHSHASTMSVALDRRFWHVEMGYVDEIESKLVSSKALLELAGEIRNAGLAQPFGTDSLVKVHRAIQDFGIKQGTTGLVHMFRDPAAREVLRPMIDVRLAELSRDYNQEIKSEIEDLSDSDLFA